METTSSSSSSSSGYGYGSYFSSEDSPKDELVERSVDAASPKKKVLLIGEGNFSFAVAYHRLHPTYKLIATSYDSKDKVNEKYDAKNYLLELSGQGKGSTKVCVFHEISICMDLAEQLGKLERGSLDEMRFNFPYAINEHNHVLLIKNFFKQGAQFLKMGGKLIIGSEDTKDYNDKFENFAAAREYNFQLISRRIWDKEGDYKRLGYKNVTNKQGVNLLNKYLALEWIYKKVENLDTENRGSSGLEEDDSRMIKDVGDVYRIMRLNQLLEKHERILPSEKAQAILKELRKNKKIGGEVYKKFFIHLETCKTKEKKIDLAYTNAFLAEWKALYDRVSNINNILYDRVSNINNILCNRISNLNNAFVSSQEFIDSSNLNEASLKTDQDNFYSENNHNYSQLRHQIKVLTLCFAQDSVQYPSLAAPLSVMLRDLFCLLKGNPAFPDWFKEQVGIASLWVDCNVSKGWKETSAKEMPEIVVR